MCGSVRLCQYKFQLHDISARIACRAGTLSQTLVIKELSAGVAEWLEKEEVVLSSEQALYSYAVYSLLFGLLPIFLAFVLGYLFRMFRESLLMILPFMLIRKFSGGYHLNDSKKCVTCSILLLSLALWVVKIFFVSQSTALLSSLVSLSSLSLWILSPIDNNSRKLTADERYIFRKITRVLSVIGLTAYQILHATAPKTYYVSIGVGIVLVAILQLPCLLKKYNFYCMGNNQNHNN